MRDIDKRNAHALLDIFELVLHVLAQAKVQSAQRLVEQQHLRAVDKRARDGDTLLLTAGKGCDAPVFKALEADDLQHLGHTVVNLLLGELRQTKTEGDVVVYVQMREQRVSLEDGVDFSLIGWHVVDALSIKKHIAGRRRQKTTDNS